MKVHRSQKSGSVNAEGFMTLEEISYIGQAVAAVAVLAEINAKQKSRAAGAAA